MMAKWSEKMSDTADYYLPKAIVGEQTITTTTKDMVNSPSHYASSSIECIDYIESYLSKEEFIGYLRGNITKYLHRFRDKNGAEDLEKAKWYMQKLINLSYLKGL